MKKHTYLLIIAMAGLVVFSQCSKKAKYEHMVKEGLESGIRHDTIFLGIYLGMTAEDFYKHCWELNKQGLVRQGEGNSSVLYEMNDEFKAKVEMNFYPNFFKDKIYEMPVKFRFKGWAPWTKEYSGDSLQLELIELYKEWYGDGFIEINHQERGKAFVKVDGNRRISIYKDRSADGTVWALYRDLSIEAEAKNEQKEARGSANE